MSIRCTLADLNVPRPDSCFGRPDSAVPEDREVYFLRTIRGDIALQSVPQCLRDPPGGRDVLLYAERATFYNPVIVSCFFNQQENALYTTKERHGPH